MFKSTGTLPRALVMSILALACIPVAAGRAWAGEYHVYSCRMPNEQPAPADGWVGSTSVSSATVVVQNTCASGGALTAALANGVKHEVGTSAMWAFSAPAGQAVIGATLWRAGVVEGGAAQNATYDFQIAAPTQTEAFSECVYISKCSGEVGESGKPISLANEVPVPSRNLGPHIYLIAACGGLPEYRCPESKATNGYATVVYLYAADTLLEQTAQPTVTPGSVGGELATASTVSGTASVTFEARDAGAGVYQAVVSVDEKAIGATVLDSNGGHCANVGQTTDGLPAFLYLQPCAPAVSADVPLDTTSLSDGVHHLVISVTDAAGDSTVVLDRKIDVANKTSAPQPSSGESKETQPGGTQPGGTQTQPGGTQTQPGGSTTPPGGTQAQASGAQPQTSGVQTATAAAGAPNGSPASAHAVLTARWQATARSGFTARWGRAARIVGRLTTADGTPIAGASIQVIATPTSQGAAAAAIATPRTHADGRFSVRLSPRSGSERIALAYRAHIGDAVPGAVRTLILSVPAALSLRVRPSVSHVGGTIVFTGVLRGGPIPAGGKQLMLQARAPGAAWRTFQALSTDRHGRYRTTYRFRLPGPITYRFRAVSRQEADFPFATGTSNVVRVKER